MEGDTIKEAMKEEEVAKEEEIKMDIAIFQMRLKLAK